VTWRSPRTNDSGSAGVTAQSAARFQPSLTSCFDETLTVIYPDRICKFAGIELECDSSMTIGWGAMAKYDPLAQYLRSQSASGLTLSFKAIERLLDAQLPRSAREQQEWWWNDLAPDSSHVQARSWVRSGYLVTNVDFAEQTVTFARRTLNPTSSTANGTRFARATDWAAD
jgi:hypothetical protein